jgi:hypothetical protein
MSITNTGGSTATGVGASLGIGFPAIPLAIMNGPNPPGLVSIAAGASQLITWTYSVGGAGPAPFYTSLSGTDSYTGGALSGGNTAAGSYGTSATLSAKAVVAPATVSAGQWMSIVLNVSNTGDVPATGVSATLFAVGGTAGVAWESGPIPAGPVTIFGGSSQAFTWTYSTSGSGGASFSASVTGTDSCSGQPRIAGGAVAGTVQVPASLAAAVSVSTTTVRQGNPVTIVLTVTNQGQAAVVSGMPSSSAIPSPVAAAVLTGGPLPAGPVSIAGGTAQSFTWVYAGTATGYVDFTGTLSGVDANSGRPVQGWLPTPPVFVSPSAALAARAVTVPATVKQGETFEIRLTVTNTGSIAATGISLGAGISDPVAATVVGLPVDVGGGFTGTLAPGASVTRVWTVRADRSGTLALAPSASGVDAGDGTPVAAQAAAAETVTPRFEEEIIVYPNPVAGDRLTIAFKLREDADLVAVEAFNLGMQRVFQGSWAAVSVGEGEVTVPGVTGWAPGPYLLRVRATLRSGARQVFPLQKVVVKR